MARTMDVQLSSRPRPILELLTSLQFPALGLWCSLGPPWLEARRLEPGPRREHSATRTVAATCSPFSFGEKPPEFLTLFLLHRHRLACIDLPKKRRKKEFCALPVQDILNQSRHQLSRPGQANLRQVLVQEEQRLDEIEGQARVYRVWGRVSGLNSRVSFWGVGCTSLRGSRYAA